MKFKMRYAVSLDGKDHFPVIFRPDCERTVCNWQGKSEGLLEIILRLKKAGYDLRDSL